MSNAEVDFAGVFRRNITSGKSPQKTGLLAPLLALVPSEGKTGERKHFQGARGTVERFDNGKRNIVRNTNSHLLPSLPFLAYFICAAGKEEMVNVRNTGN